MRLALAFRSEGNPDGTQKVEVAEALLHTSKVIPLPSREAVDLARAALFGRSKRISGILGSVHPFLVLKPGEIHPSTRDGINSIVGRLCLGNFESVAHISATKLEGSGVLVGGPVTNIYARLLFGSDDISPLLGTELPARFEYLSEMTDPAAFYKHPWKIIVGGISSSKECLLITSLPLDNDDRILNIAGLHSAGTRAIDLLLKDRKVLQQLANRTRNFLGWQALIEVKARNRDEAIALGEIQVFEISNVDFNSQRYLLRGQLILTENRAEELIGMLPNAYFMEPPSNSAGSQRGAPGLESKVPISHMPIVHKLFETRPRISVRTQEDERVRRGRPPKGATRRTPKLRRLDINLSAKDFDRIKRIRELTDAMTAADVIRNALLVCEEVLGTIAGKKTAPPRNRKKKRG